MRTGCALPALHLPVIISQRFRSHWFLLLFFMVISPCVVLFFRGFHICQLHRLFMDWITMNIGWKGGKQFATMHLKGIMGYLTFVHACVCVRVCTRTSPCGSEGVLVVLCFLSDPLILLNQLVNPTFFSQLLWLHAGTYKRSYHWLHMGCISLQKNMIFLLKHAFWLPKGDKINISFLSVRPDIQTSSEILAH